MMFRLVELVSRMRGLFGQEKADVEFGSEMERHLELLEERFVRQGLRPKEAAYSAILLC